MKIKIGPYINWWGPYQIADLLQKVGVSEDRCHEIGGWLSNTWVNAVCTWVHSKRNRTQIIKIDKYDTWGMDSTLALIILPMLKQLQATKHGSPLVDDEDVPENLRSTSAPPKKHEWDTDDFLHDRWDWVMSEIIWAFEQLNDENNDSQFHTGKTDLKFDNGSVEIVDEPGYHFDVDGYTVHHARIANALTLFGKYYQGLWD